MNATFSLRALMVCVTLVAFNIAFVRALERHYEANDSLLWGALPLHFSAIALLPILNIAAFLWFVKRARLREFFLLSLFVVGESRTVHVGIVNIVSIACTMAATWVISASFVFPNQAAAVCEFVLVTMNQICSRFDPQIASALELPLSIGSLMLAAGAIWVPIFGIFTIVTLRYGFAIHASVVDGQEFQRCGMLAMGGEPSVATEAAS